MNHETAMTNLYNKGLIIWLPKIGVPEVKAFPYERPNCRALNLVGPSIQKKMTTDMKKMKKKRERNPFFLVTMAL